MSTLAVRAALGVLWALHFLPLWLLAPLGRGVGTLMFHLSRERRTVARINLQACFPQWSEAERERVLREHFKCFGRTLVEAGIAWWGSEARLRRLVRVEGLEHLHAIGAGRFIGLVPHFAALDLEGIRMTLEFRGMAVYAHQKNRYFDAFLVRVRSRFNGARLVARQEGIKAIIRGLKEGFALQLSPDMDLGAKDAVFVPFLGVQAATVTVLSRLARLTGAAVLPLVIRQLPGAQGYVITIYPRWDDYPGTSIEEDTRRMNAFIEARVLEAPEQYLWLHKRFKTRPEGEARFYR